MSRSSALRETLNLSPNQSLEVISIVASGDCLYDGIHELLSRHYSTKHHDNSVDNTMALPPLLQNNNNNTDGGNNDIIKIPTSQSMRDHVADQLSSEQLDLYKMYATAGLDEYKFASNLTLEELKVFAKKSGKTNGPGNCFWADEFALRTISDGLYLTLLIIDDQATRGVTSGSSSGRKRRRNNNEQEESSSSRANDNRFVFIGNYPRAVILHRSRRQHYNAIVVDNHPVIENFEHCPLNVRSLWAIGKSEDGGNKEEEKVEGGLMDSKPPARSVEEKKKPIAAMKNATATKSSSSSQVLGNFYCGCAGFSSSSWVGNFYPKSLVGNNTDRQLDYYQQHFRTVEINSTFYGIPTESTVKKWKKSFSKTFKVVVKAPNGVTHEKSELDLSVLSTFLERMKELNGTLACMLIQCPRTLSVTASQIQQLHTMLERDASWYKGHIAFEFRNEPTYFDEEVRQMLKQNNFSLVLHPNSVGRSTIGTSTSGRGNGNLVEYQLEQLSTVAAAGKVHSNFVYIRLHGRNDEHRGEYTMNELTEIAQQIHSWREKGIEVFCFLLNDLEPTTSQKSQSPSQPWDKWCAMPKNAKQLEYHVYRLSNGNIPDAPKKPKSTLLNFFGKG